MRRLSLAVALAVVALSLCVCAADTQLSVVVNGKALKAHGLVHGKRVLVPIIEVAKAAGASDVGVIENVKPVRIKVCLGSRCAIFKVGDGPRDVLLIDKVYYINYDLLAKALGGAAKYDAKAKKVVLQFGKKG